MKMIKNMLVILIFTIFMSSCSSSTSQNNNNASNYTNPGQCPDGEIEWIDLVMINGIKYYSYFPEPIDGNSTPSIEKGRKLGEVTYKMADSACSDHKTKNGDATFLEKGTPIYELKGYPTDLMVFANNDVYVAHTNIKAKTAGELLPIRNVVKDIHIESTEDGKQIHTFSHLSKINFLDAWDRLKIKDLHTLYNEGKMEGKTLFLEIELTNRVSFRLSYQKDTNIFNIGAISNKKMKATIEYELSGVKGEHLYME